MNKYLRWTLLKWIRLEKRLLNRKKNKSIKDKQHGYRLNTLEDEIEFINKPSYGIFERLIGPKQPKHIEHYVPIDWAQRRIDFLNEPMPEESQWWADLGREDFLTLANPLSEDEQKWFDMDRDEFIAWVNEDNK